MTRRPLILLSNDDGYDAPGLVALRQALLVFADVIVCAPARNQSASSHSLTLKDILRLRRPSEGVFAVDGTPADCVYIAMHTEQRILQRRPDLCVSGMNHGPNLGIDVVYSGTVAAAREAAKQGVPAIAVSASNRAHRGKAAALGAGIVADAWKWIASDAPEPTPLLNVNIPPGDDWSVVVTRVGNRSYDDGVICRDDPRGSEYMWIGGSNVQHDPDEATDTGAWEKGHASVTPLSLNFYEAAHAAPVTTALSGLRRD